MIEVEPPSDTKLAGMLLRNNELYKFATKLFSDSKKSVKILTFFMTLPLEKDRYTTKGLLDLLVKKQREENIELKILLNKESTSEKYNSTIINRNAYSYLKSQKAEVKYFSGSESNHSKLILIDDSIVILGSHNFTRNSMHFLDETSVLLKSRKLNSYYSKIFENRWSLSSDSNEIL